MPHPAPTAAPAFVALAYRLAVLPLMPDTQDPNRGAFERARLRRIAAHLGQMPPSVVAAGRQALEGIKEASASGNVTRPEASLLGACLFLLMGAPLAPRGGKQPDKGMDRQAMVHLACCLAALHLLLPVGQPLAELACLERVHALLRGTVPSVDVAAADLRACLDAIEMDGDAVRRPSVQLLLACWRLLVGAEGELPEPAGADVPAPPTGPLP